MKVFLTGASGILGSDIAIQLRLAGHDVLGFSSADISIGSFNDVMSKVSNYKPDVVIHCAALTNVDLCEDDHEAAILTNVNGSENVAKAAAAVNAGIVYISSCGVYGNGKATPYTEIDSTQPLTYHHYTKLEGEKKVIENNSRHIIIRPGWLFGGTLQHKKNFVEARRKEAANAPVIKSAADKAGSPTYTLDLAKQIITLINGNYTGIFNAVNRGCASRFEYVSEIVRLFKLTTIVEPVNSNAFPRKANMPDNECLENFNLTANGINQMPEWKEALKRYIEKTYGI